MIALSELKTADYNPRKMSAQELAKLKASLDAFGFVEPIVARAEDGLVIGGHQRLAAFRELLAERGVSDPGAAKVPVIAVEDLDDGKAKQLNLALNRIHGEWDYEKLAVIFEEFGDEWVADVHGLTGFDEREVEDIRALMSFDHGLAEIPSEEEVQEGIAHVERRFVFQLEDEEGAEVVRKALRAKGWTGPGNAVAAFVEVCRCALPGRG